MIGSHTGTPEAYLVQFARVQNSRDRKPKVWTYQRGKRSFAATPERIGKENGYFAVTSSDGTRDESMESTLACLEGKGARLLPFFSCETFGFSHADVQALLAYVALIFARTTARRSLSSKLFSKILDAYKELAADPVWLEEQATAFTCVSGVPAGAEEISSATTRVIARLSKPDQANNSFIQGLLAIAQSIFRDLCGKPWQIWEAPEGHEFLTGDNPVITVKAGRSGSFSLGWGFREPGVTTMFPVSPRCCLVLGPNLSTGRYWRRATPRDVEGVNRGITACMTRFIYSASYSESTEWLVNHLGATIVYGVNAFVPAWFNNAPDHIRRELQRCTSLTTRKISPRSTTSETTRRTYSNGTESN